MKKISLTVIISLSLIFIFQSCSDDVTNTNNGGTTGGGGWHPTLNFQVGQQFVYTLDSLTPSGVPVRKRTRSTNTINAQINYPPGGPLCYPVTGLTFDTATGQTTPEAYWFRYDQTEGKYYQYGIRQLINISQPASWDVVANFDAARGTSYFIGDIDYTITVPGIGTVRFTGPLNGKVADSTTITTTGAPVHSVSCYRIEMTASISGSTIAGTVTANVIIDYYLGWNDPVGLVELKLRPFSFTVAGIPGIAPQPGFDRKLYTHN
jgi:hypothetical protein